MPGRMEFQFNVPKSNANLSTRRDPTAPFDILIMADLSARAHRETPGLLVDLANRPLLAVDVDSLDAVMARLAPKLRLAPMTDNDVALTISFNQLDDFHPDALYQRLEVFQALRRTRARLLNPASFAQAVAELTPSPPAETVQTEPAPVEGEAELLERLLGQAPTQPAMARPADAGAAAIQSLVQAIVQPHIVHTDARQPAWVAAVDATIGDQLRMILHQPAFQALEATWRSVQGLIADLDSDAVRVFLLDVTRQELLTDLHSAGGDPKATSLYTLLVDQGARMPDGPSWSLLV
ncbi:MAG: type VI secretion system contractile sheath large subunit, partial [Candidatus Competibacteraceae bacterium]|nr:type VI secretion system contractile sheath large subunit [Candidatus Competibacteraceae bacterium]